MSEQPDLETPEAIQGFIQTTLDTQTSDPLAQLAILADLQTELRAVLVWKVAEAREQSSTWGDIGDALSVSQQAAWERFGKASK